MATAAAVVCMSPGESVGPKVVGTEPVVRRAAGCLSTGRPFPVALASRALIGHFLRRLSRSCPAPESAASARRSFVALGSGFESKFESAEHSDVAPVTAALSVAVVAAAAAGEAAAGRRR